MEEFEYVVGKKRFKTLAGANKYALKTGAKKIAKVTYEKQYSPKKGAKFQLFKGKKR